MAASGSEKRARALSITLRVSEKEKQRLQEQAERSGVSLGAFIRSLALDKNEPKAKRFSVPQGKRIALMLASLGTLVNEVRRIENSSSNNSGFVLIHRELAYLRDQCFKALGRKP